MSTVLPKVGAIPQARRGAADGLALFLCGMLLVTPLETLFAQGGAAPSDSTRVVMFEHQFGGDNADSVALTLTRGVVYRAELTGTGTLVIESRRRGGAQAFLVPLGSAAGDALRRFEVYAVQTGPHVVRVSDLPPGTVVTLRFFQDVTLGGRIAERRNSGFAIGLLVAGGAHSGFRLDPAHDARPQGGRDVEGCLLIEPGGRFGACVGAGRQSFPGESLSVTWAFLEGRVRLASVHLPSGLHTEVGATVRFSEALSSGSLNVSAALFSYGLQITQHLIPEQPRRGWSLFIAWQHGRLGYAPETEFLTTDRFTAGIEWLP